MRIGMTMPLWFCVEVNYDNAWPKQPRDYHVHHKHEEFSKGRTKVVEHCTLLNRSAEIQYQKIHLWNNYAFKKGVMFFFFLSCFPYPFLESVQLFGYHDKRLSRCAKTPARQVFDLVGLWDWWMARWSQRLINYNHQWSCNFNVTRTCVVVVFLSKKSHGG